MQAKNYNRQVIDLKQDDKGYVSVGNKSYGYCKIEKRGQKLRIKISVNGLMNSNRIYKAYLIRSTEKNSDMIPIGVIELDNNNYSNLNVTTDSSKIMGQSISIDEISIVAIVCKDDNDNFSFPLVGYIKEIKYPWKKSLNTNKRNKKKKEVIKKDIIVDRNDIQHKEINYVNNNDNNKSFSSQNDKNSKNVENLKKDESINLKKDKSINQTLCSNEKTEPEKTEKDEVYESNKSIEIDDIGNQTFDIIKNHFDDKELAKIHDNIFREYPKMRPFEGKYSDVEWIRIEPADIIYFPIESWLLTNNTFLLNAYRKYKHLILGRNEECKDGKPYFILGVPGIHYPKDKVAAYFYGFKDFICCSGAKTKSGEYGYWIKEIDCPM
ncbi:hypothetical protein SH1V18_43440 [Vallitalea longa]|uniref:DUF6128 domain-containing protein n=1 Tax=Vallitalea longa TaxID=2936439 RepID=A0A9W6DIF8_9FIRM|nr:DUF6128 domain-containing protein [Vallitalea longa]GKX31864.1 hypothetical protein SH1V18_43440 [Vallitalea longa]